MDAELAGARKTIQLDIGFGDRVIPGTVEIDFPVLLDLPVPKIYIYSKESVIAEKFQAIVELEFANSRMKDFYDILSLASDEPFNMQILREAISTTFIHRKTSLEDRDVVFSEVFKKDPAKQEQWAAFLRRHKLSSSKEFYEVIERIKLFLEPIFIEKGEKLGKLIWNSKIWKWEKEG